VPRSVIVALGGLIGSVARYWLTGVVQQLGGDRFPLGTLAVNVIGSLAIGAFVTLSLERGLIRDDVRIFLTTGLCGGFTTMSAFSYETMALVRDGERLLAVINLAATNGVCLAAVWLGTLVARLL